ncbi:hypothetical protein NEOKW01_0147 [Nematocida sp. AWRm80]|nr:hypothetical protein NEOKW01_0147 [Nematocida sp. AWRm80]
MNVIYLLLFLSCISGSTSVLDSTNNTNQSNGIVSFFRNISTRIRSTLVPGGRTDNPGMEMTNRANAQENNRLLEDANERAQQLNNIEEDEIIEKYNTRYRIKVVCATIVCIVVAIIIGWCVFHFWLHPWLNDILNINSPMPDPKPVIDPIHYSDHKEAVKLDYFYNHIGSKDIPKDPKKVIEAQKDIISRMNDILSKPIKTGNYF